MFLLIATYDLRTSEVAALRLDPIEWRTGRLRVPRAKANTPLLLPLTEEVGAALIDYIRNARPESGHREVFLRVRAPAGTLRATAVTEAFQGGRAAATFRSRTRDPTAYGTIWPPGLCSALPFGTLFFCWMRTMDAT
jgi:integrase